MEKRGKRDLKLTLNKVVFMFSSEGKVKVAGSWSLMSTSCFVTAETFII